MLRGTARLGDLDQDGDLDLLGAFTAWNRRLLAPNAGYRQQYGNGSAGTGGWRPLLSSIGPVRAGSTTSVRVVSGYGGSFGVLFASPLAANLPNALPGVTAYIGAPFVSPGVPLGGTLGQPGAGSFELPIVIPPGAGGAMLFLQCLVFDPAAPIAKIEAATPVGSART